MSVEVLRLARAVAVWMTPSRGSGLWVPVDPCGQLWTDQGTEPPRWGPVAVLRSGGLQVCALGGEPFVEQMRSAGVSDALRQLIDRGVEVRLAGQHLALSPMVSRPLEAATLTRLRGNLVQALEYTRSDAVSQWPMPDTDGAWRGQVAGSPFEVRLGGAEGPLRIEVSVDVPLPAHTLVRMARHPVARPVRIQDLILGKALSATSSDPAELAARLCRDAVRPVLLEWLDQPGARLEGRCFGADVGKPGRGPAVLELASELVLALEPEAAG